MVTSDVSLPLAFSHESHQKFVFVFVCFVLGILWLSNGVFVLVWTWNVKEVGSSFICDIKPSFAGIHAISFWRNDRFFIQSSVLPFLGYFVNISHFSHGSFHEFQGFVHSIQVDPLGLLLLSNLSTISWRHKIHRWHFLLWQSTQNRNRLLTKHNVQHNKIMMIMIFDLPRSDTTIFLSHLLWLFRVVVTLSTKGDHH